MTDKKLQVVFAPGVLEEMETQYSPEELQDIMDELKVAIDNGSLFNDSTVIDLDTIKEDDPELYAILKEQLLSLDSTVDPFEKHKMH